MNRLKKWTALLLCVALLLCSCGAMAAGLEYTLVEKLEKQPQESSFEGNGTFRVRGTEMSGSMNAVFQRALLLNGKQLTVSGTGHAGDREAHIALCDGETPLVYADILSDAGHIAFTSPLTGDGLYGFARENKTAALYNVLGMDATLWMIADFFVQDVMEQPAFSQIAQDVWEWLGSFCTISEAGEETVLSYRVPYDLFLKQAVLSLEAIGNNRRALAAFMEVYPGVDVNALAQQLRHMQLTDDFEMIRVFDAGAEMKETTISLPLSAEGETTLARIIITPTAFDRRIEVTVYSESGETVFGTEKTDATTRRGVYTVADEEGNVSGFAWTLFYSEGAVSYDRVKDLAAQNVTLRCGVTPVDGENEITLSMDLALSSGRDKSSPLQAQMLLTLQDSATDAAAELELSVRVHVRTAPQKLDPATIIYLDTMKPEYMEQLLRQALQHFDSALGR